MIGTIRERLSAVVGAMVKQDGLSVDALAIAGHPNAIRPFALEFDRDTSRAEIEFKDDGAIVWKGFQIVQHRHLGDEAHIFVCIDRIRAVRIPLDGFPAIDDMCPRFHRPAVEAALKLITPRAT